ncbi:hypothetical protein G9A89_012807 [Geosiphon pyriformis]|nr:hypothetical protein G9A89_012807 [Geosiphon pyriformis]
MVDFLHADINWFRSSLVWHPDLHLVFGFISRSTTGTHTYFMKALHYQLLVTTQTFRLLSTATRFEHQVTGLLFNPTPEIVTCIILQRTSTNTNLKVAESENIEANYLGFTKSLFQHYCQHLGLNYNHILVESAFNFYVNKRITYLLETPVNIKSAREAFYSELIQNTNLPTNHNFAFIIMEINKKIEYHTQQRYPITYVSKGKEKLQTPAVTSKRIQPPTWKKTKVESPTNPSYHYTPGSTINITSTGVTTLNMTLAFGQFPFQKVTESEKKKEKEAEDQEFTYQNPIAENPEFETLNLQTQQNLNPENPEIETSNIQIPPTQDN